MPIFPRSARLLKAADYTAVFKHPDINLTAGPLRIRARKNRMPTARLGLVVPKRGNPKAVRRNRIKRIVRDSFRRHRACLPALDIVVQVFGQIEDQRLHELLERQWREIEQARDRI